MYTNLLLANPEEVKLVKSRMRRMRKNGKKFPLHNFQTGYGMERILQNRKGAVYFLALSYLKKGLLSSKLCPCG